MKTTVQSIKFQNFNNLDLVSFCHAEADLPEVAPNIISNMAMAWDGSVFVGTAPKVGESKTYSVFAHKIKNVNLSFYNALTMQNAKKAELGPVVITTSHGATGATVSQTYSNCNIVTPMGITGNADKPSQITLSFNL